MATATPSKAIVTVHRLLLHRVAERALARMDRKTRARTERALDALRVHPYYGVDTKPLEGRLQGFHRLRVGGWRVVYEMLEREGGDGVVYVLDVRSRGDVY